MNTIKISREKNEDYRMKIDVSMKVGILHTCLRIVYPQSNPSSHVKTRTPSKNLFYISDVIFNWTEILFDFSGTPKMQQSFEHTVIKLNDVSSFEEIRNELIFEHLKLSFIKELKLRRIQVMKSSLTLFLAILPLIVFLHYWGLSCYMPPQK
jgi:hypothetical protein